MLIVVVLGCAAGLLAGFGSAVVWQRQAAAQVAAPVPGGDPVNAALLAGGGSAEGAALPGEGENFVTKVYKAASPAVVHITNKATRVNWSFFGPQQYESEATGSGVIVDAKGFILTNQHVIEGAEEILVILNDGREFTASTVGVDPGTDLALLKVEADGSLPTAPLGDSAALQVGEWVVAIGNPRGYDWTVTTGVVSALNREIPSAWTGQTMRGMIQTDAAINPGNSGGPLLNTRGEVIGINELIISTSGGDQGIGLAIPINLAKEVLSDLIQHGRVIRPWLGIETEHITPMMAAHFNFPVDYGEVVVKRYAPSPAEQAGLVAHQSSRDGKQYQYDIISAVDGEKLDKERELLDIIREHQPGDVIKLEVYRITNGEFEIKQVSVTLEALPANAPLIGII